MKYQEKEKENFNKVFAQIYLLRFPAYNLNLFYSFDIIVFLLSVVSAIVSHNVLMHVAKCLTLVLIHESFLHR